MTALAEMCTSPQTQVLESRSPRLWRNRANLPVEPSPTGHLPLHHREICELRRTLTALESLPPQQGCSHSSSRERFLLPCAKSRVRAQPRTDNMAPSHLRN